MIIISAAVFITIEYLQQYDRWGDTVLSSVSTTARLLLYVSPIVIPWAINRGWASPDGVVWMSKVPRYSGVVCNVCSYVQVEKNLFQLLVGVGFVVAGAVIMRTLGRVSNPVYTRFTSVLAAAHRDFTPATKAAMAEYDFTFSSWPVDFNVAAETGCVLNHHHLQCLARDFV